MCAYRADLRRFRADHDVAAVRALPNHVSVAREHKPVLHIFEQPAVALLVLFFDLAYHFKQIGDAVEPLFLCFLGKVAYISVHS